MVIRKGIRKYFDTLSHDSQYVSECVNFILKKLKIGKKEKLKIWSDGCKGHFKNKNMISNIFEIFKRYQFIEYNFFPSYHGKNLCDSRFSVISRKLLHIQNASAKKINNVSELAIYLNNKNSRNAETVVYQRELTNPLKVVIPIKNVTNIQKYWFNKNKLKIKDFDGNIETIKIDQRVEKNKIIEKNSK